MNETTVTVVGTVCSEVRYSQPADETPIARFQIRTTPRRYDKRTGTWSDGDPSYYTATCFRALADHVASSMGVGDPVVATGRLRINRWRRGEENMITADLDVQAIGHDLRWGTTVYRRANPPTRIPGPGRHRNESIPTSSPAADTDVDADGVTAGISTATERSAREADPPTLAPAASAARPALAAAATAGGPTAEPSTTCPRSVPPTSTAPVFSAAPDRPSPSDETMELPVAA